MSSGPRTDSGRATLVLLRALLLIAACVAGTQAWASAFNTLHRSGAWTSGKIGLAVPVMGAAAAWVTRPALAGRRLDLGSWYGHQQVAWSREVSLDRLSFTAEIPDGAYLDVWFDDGLRHGVRLSRDPHRPSGTWTMEDRQFTGFVPLGVSVPARSEPALEFWETRRLRLGDTDLSLPGDGPPHAFGFRGGLESAWVDDVTFVSRGERTVHRFSGDRRPLVGALCFVALLLGMEGLRRRAPHGEHLTLALCGLTAIGAVAALFIVDRTATFVPHEDTIDYGPYPQQTTTVAQVTAEIRALPAPDAPEVLILGSSQTWGSGATSLEETWVHAACDDLPVACVNGGVPGATAAVLAPLGRVLLGERTPAALVVVLGHNDADPARLRANLDGLVTEALGAGVAVLLVGEPTNPELGPDAHDATRDALRALAGARGLPYVDMQPWMESAPDGWLWWDRVHLTDAGHARFARGVRPALEALLSPRRRTRTHPR